MKYFLRTFCITSLAVTFFIPHSEVFANPDGKIGYSPDVVVINEGDTETLTFTLDEPIIGPDPGETIVTVTLTPNNADITVTPDTIVFTSSAWQVPETVQVSPSLGFSYTTNIHSSITFTATSDSPFYDGYSSSVPVTLGNLPTIMSTDPSDGGTSASINPTITANFSEAIETNSLRTSISPCHFEGSCARPSGVLSNGDTTYTITMPETLQHNFEYTVTLTSGASAAGGGVMEDYSWSFTTELEEVATESKSNKKSSGKRTYGCKDPNALNYNFFSSHRQSLCSYGSNTSPLANTSSSTQMSLKVLEILELLKLLNLI